MLINSVPYMAQANDPTRAIGIALQNGWIESICKKPAVHASAFRRLTLTEVARAMHTAGWGIHLPIAPHIETHLVAEIPQPSPRNKMSRIPFPEQLKVWDAAEAKRARKQAQRVLDAGGSVSEEL